MNKKSQYTNQVRIIGGSCRGRKLTFPDADGLRPTADMVRERLFNWLGQDLTGSTVLDLFSGSGALGLEAASRHATRVDLVEHHRPAAQALSQHIRTLGLSGQAHIHFQEAFAFLQAALSTYDVVFLDPPFAWQQWDTLFRLLKSRLNPDALVYIEAGTLPTLPEWLSVYREGKSGKSRFILAQFTPPTP